MVEEPSAGAEGATATQDDPEAAAVAAEPGTEQAARPEPIKIALDMLTEEAKKEAEEDGRPTEEIPYSIQAEETKPHSILSLKFQIEAADFRAVLDRFYTNLRKEITLPGFRKGRAPVKLIRIRMGSDADRDAMTDAATRVLREELLKRDLRPTADPHLVDWTLEDGAPLIFETEIEIEPKIDLQNYKGLSVTVETHEVAEAMVDSELERMRAQFATSESAPEGAKLAEGQIPLIDLKVTGQGGNELKHLDREAWLISDFKNELPPELAEKMIGLAVGETASAEIVSSRRNRRGEEVQYKDTFAATLRDIKVTRLPDLDDEFAKDLEEYDTLDELRASIRKDLEKMEEDRQRGESVAKVIEAIVENNPVDAPRSMIDQAQYRSMMNDSMQLSRMGLRIQDVVSDPGSYLTSQQSGAEFLVKRSLVMGKLAELEKLEVSDEDVEKEIAEIAERAGRKSLAIRAQLEADGRLDALSDQLLQRKVGDFLIENNSVQKVAAPPPADPREQAEAGGEDESGETDSAEPAAEKEAAPEASEKAAKKKPSKAAKKAPAKKAPAKKAPAKKAASKKK